MKKKRRVCEACKMDLDDPPFTWRDRMAGKALNGMMHLGLGCWSDAPCTADNEKNQRNNATTMAKMAYVWADAMRKARKG